MDSAERHWVVTREVEVDGAEVSEGVLVPGSVDPLLSWDELGQHAISTWGYRLSSTETHRAVLDDMLLQFGWERSHGPRGLHHFPVRRAAPSFLAERVGARVLVSTADGILLADYDVGSQDDFTVLEENGWLVTNADQDPGPDRPHPVRPFDWPRVIRFVSAARKSAQAKAEQCDLGWREVIREGLLAGQEARTLAELTGVTPQRIYQVRDGRR